jgi:hypothetical protein
LYNNIWEICQLQAREGLVLFEHPTLRAPLLRPCTPEPEVELTEWSDPSPTLKVGPEGETKEQQRRVGAEDPEKGGSLC